MAVEVNEGAEGELVLLQLARGRAVGATVGLGPLVEVHLAHLVAVQHDFDLIVVTGDFDVVPVADGFLGVALRLY